jgi:MoaA/NifB/PqqE/SkfB family radical SAM enzyme
LLDMFPTIQRAGIGGGEPLLCPELPAIFETCARRLRNFSISTNGTLVCKRKNDIDWSLVGGVNIAGNSDSATGYAQLTGTHPEHQTQMLEGVEYLRTHGVKVIMSFVMTRQNVTKMADYASFAKKHGVHHVAFQSVCPRADDYARFEKVGIFRRDLATMSVIRQQRRRVQQLGGVHVNLWPQPLGNGVGQGCLMAKHYMAVDGRGNVAICCRGPGPRPEVGSILIDGPGVWSGKMAEMRKRVYDASNKLEKCLLCKANWRR